MKPFTSEMMKSAQIERLRDSVRFEFKNRHSFKRGRFTPRDNVADYIQIIRRMRKEEA